MPTRHAHRLTCLLVLCNLPEGDHSGTAKAAAPSRRECKQEGRGLGHPRAASAARTQAGGGACRRLPRASAGLELPGCARLCLQGALDISPEPTLQRRETGAEPERRNCKPALHVVQRGNLRLTQPEPGRPPQPSGVGAVEAGLVPEQPRPVRSRRLPGEETNLLSLAFEQSDEKQRPRTGRPSRRIASRPPLLCRTPRRGQGRRGLRRDPDGVLQPSSRGQISPLISRMAFGF